MSCIRDERFLDAMIKDFAHDHKPAHSLTLIQHWFLILLTNNAMSDGS